MDKLARWWTLAPRERRLVVMAAGLLALMPLAVRVRSLPRLLPSRASRTPAPATSPSRIAGLVAAVAHGVPWSTSCLEQALATAWLLAWCGMRGAMVVAVRPPLAGFRAHAWMEIDGHPAGARADGPWHAVACWPVPCPPRLR